MAVPFFEQPILNGPYSPPARHHALDEDGQPLDSPPVEGRRRSEIITPVPMPKKRKGKTAEPTFDLGDAGPVEDEPEYNPTPIINEIREHVASWRALKNPADWGVTPTTARLLTHWREYNFSGPKPFFCQVEPVETIIWLAEFVPNRPRQYRTILAHLQGGNETSNPELYRLAMKLATGAGKTTVMAVLIAWQARALDRQGPGEEPLRPRFPCHRTRVQYPRAASGARASSPTAPIRAGTPRTPRTRGE